MAEAVERLGQAVRDGWGAGYDASVVRGLSKSTLDGYLGALAKLRRRERMQPGCDRRRVLEDELGDIAARDVGEGNIKKLFSGVRLLEKLRCIKSTVQPGDWYLVLGVEKERERQAKGAVKDWASMEALRYMAGVVHTKAEWKILTLAALSCARCLRASEAITARAEGSELVFRGTKSRSGEQRQEMGQWTAKWPAFLARLKASPNPSPNRGAGSGVFPVVWPYASISHWRTFGVWARAHPVLWHPHGAPPPPPVAPVFYIVEHPNQEGDTCIDWISQYCWTNGWNCLWRGHSVYQNRPLIPPWRVQPVGGLCRASVAPSAKGGRQPRRDMQEFVTSGHMEFIGSD